MGRYVFEFRTDMPRDHLKGNPNKPERAIAYKFLESLEERVFRQPLEFRGALGVFPAVLKICEELGYSFEGRRGRQESLGLRPDNRKVFCGNFQMGYLEREEICTR